MVVGAEPATRCSDQARYHERSKEGSCTAQQAALADAYRKGGAGDRECDVHRGPTSRWACGTEPGTADRYVNNNRNRTRLAFATAVGLARER